MTRTGNQILDRLPMDEARRLLGYAEPLSLLHDQEIYRQDGPMPDVYFPIRGVCSVVIFTIEGKGVETATIGNEGLVGVPAYLGLDFSPATFVIQVSGDFLRLPMDVFMKQLERGGSLDRLVRRYAAYTLRHSNQTVACNALHAAEKRMARWLLMTHDRVVEDRFVLTHEYLAEMLGVRRQTVTGIAGALQKAGLLSYRRGVIEILDRTGLENASCECYEVSRILYNRIMR